MKLPKLWAQEVGKTGEDLAANWYKKQGFRIVERNYRTRFGEIDLIVQKNDKWIVFVEVKTRTGDSLGRPCEAVDIRKQKKLIAAAKQYIAYLPEGSEQLRFDVMEVFPDKKGNERFNCIENAFIL